MVRALLFILLSLLSVGEVIAAEAISPRVTRALMNIMEEAAEDPEGALAELQEIFESRGLRGIDRGVVLFERAGLLVQEERTEEAINEVEAFLATQEPRFMPNLRFMLGQLLLIEDRAPEALEHFLIWQEHQVEPSARQFSLVGYAYLQLERFTEAAELFERVIAMDTAPNPRNIELLAYIYTQLDRHEDAKGLLQGLIVQFPSEARWWRQLSLVYLLLEDMDAGAGGLAIAAELQDLSYEDVRRLASLLSALNLPADGAYVLEAGLDRFPDELSYEDQILLSDLWILAREFERAVSALRLAATLEDNSEPGLKLGQLYLQRENYTDARLALREAIDVAAEEESDQLYYLLAISEINLGNLQAASDALQRLHPDSEYATRAQSLNQFIDRQLAAAN